MANTGTYDDPIPVKGLFTKNINGEKKFFILKSGQARQTPSVTYTKLSQLENDTGFIAEATIASTYVKLASAQIIPAQHDFSAGVKIGGCLITVG